MPRHKTVRVLFYEAKFDDPANRSFDQILETLAVLPAGPERTTTFRDQTLHLKELRRINGLWIGDVSKIRLDDNMILSDLNGDEEELAYQDRGPCDKTAFLYYPVSRTLLVGEFGNGPSGSAVAGCLKMLAHLKAVELQLMLETGALERLMAMTTFLRLKIRISSMGEIPAIEGPAEHIFGMLSDTHPATASIDLRANKKQEGALRNVAAIVRSVLDSGREAVTQLLVIGSEGDADEKTTVDLFRDRLMEKVTIKLDEGERITNAVRYDCLQAAFAKRRAELDRRAQA